MENLITIPGRILFDPEEITTKQTKQGSWKKVAMIIFDGQVDHLYRWFILRRYGIHLTRPIRGPHVSFINDRFTDIPALSNRARDIKWNRVKDKWDGKSIDITLSIDTRSDGISWWLNIPEEFRTDLHDIRSELGLGRSYFGLHMTIGSATDYYPKNKVSKNIQKAKLMNIDQSKYIVDLLSKNKIC